MTRSIDLELLRTFQTVAELQSFTGAAKVLGLSQSAVSLQIRRLEENVDASLLYRNKREVRLSPAGEALLGYARQMLTLEQEALRRVQAAPAVRQIAVGLPDIFAARYLGEVVKHFKQAFPGVTPMVTCDVSRSLVEDFNRGKLDVCLTIRHDDLPGGTAVGEDELVWAGRGDFVLEADAVVPLALFPGACPYRARGVEALRQQGRAHEIVYVSQSSTAIDLAVDRGWALTLRNRRALPDHWRVFDQGDGLPDVGQVVFELRTSEISQSEAHSAFVEALRDEVAKDLVAP